MGLWVKNYGTVQFKRLEDQGLLSPWFTKPSCLWRLMLRTRRPFTFKTLS